MAESSMLRPVTSTRAFCIPCRGPTKSWRMKSSGRFCLSCLSDLGQLLAKIKSLPNHSPVTYSAATSRRSTECCNRFRSAVAL